MKKIISAFIILVFGLQLPINYVYGANVDSATVTEPLAGKEQTKTSVNTELLKEKASDIASLFKNYIAISKDKISGVASQAKTYAMNSKDYLLVLADQAKVYAVMGKDKLSDALNRINFDKKAAYDKLALVKVKLFNALYIAYLTLKKPGVLKYFLLTLSLAWMNFNLFSLKDDIVTIVDDQSKSWSSKFLSLANSILCGKSGINKNEVDVTNTTISLNTEVNPEL